jgi:hypothetical protein
MPKIIPMVLCYERDEMFEADGPDFFPADYCKTCPNCIEYKPLVLANDKWLGAAWTRTVGRAQEVICRFDVEFLRADAEASHHD